MRTMRLKLLASMLALAAMSPPVMAAEKILLVSTNVAEFNGLSSGTFLMEIAIPYDRFRRAGYEVDVVTPRGGKAAFYKSGREPAPVSTIEADPEFQTEMSYSLSPAQVRARDYVAVLIPGGYAQFTDVLHSKAIADLVSRIYRRGGVLAGVGHGTAMFVNLKLADGTPLVAGKRLTAFPWWTETRSMEQSSFGKALPFNMEEALEKLGAQVQHVPEADSKSLPVVIDEANRIATGPYASNAGVTADAVLALLGKAPR